MAKGAPEAHGFSFGRRGVLGPEPTGFEDRTARGRELTDASLGSLMAFDEDSAISIPCSSPRELRRNMSRFPGLPSVLLKRSVLGAPTGAQPVPAQDSHEFDGAIRGGRFGGQQAYSAPEISPATSAGGLVLPVGGALILVGRHRARLVEN